MGFFIPTLVIDLSGLATPNISSILTSAGWLGTFQPVKFIANSNVNTVDIPGSIDGTDLYFLIGGSVTIGGLKNGGTALKTRAHIKIENLGSINGGGGAGGHGGAAFAAYDPPSYNSDSFYANGGVGGGGQGFDSSGSMTIVTAQAGGAGVSGTAIGSNGFGPSYLVTNVVGGSGGDGGNWGQPGSDGSIGSVYGDTPSRSSLYAESAGGASGLAVDGNSYITWVANGTKLGGIA